VDRNIGADHCALCELFWDEFGSFNNCCEGCPVRGCTGQKFCEGSPYEQFDDFQYTLHRRGLHFADLQDKRGQKRLYRRRIALAQAEIDFLKSLRPKRRT
jgi:hypothetical protein